MRLFIGISLPDTISSHLGSLRGSLPSIHWNNPDTYHLTLSFLGEVKNYDLLNDLELSLEKINMPRFELTISTVDYFTSPTYESIFWASITSSSPLLLLKKKIDHTLRQLDILPKKQRFIPHITLAKGVGLNKEQISNWIYKYNLFKTEPFEICEFSLFSSYPTKNEPRYIIESSYLLQ